MKQNARKKIFQHSSLLTIFAHSLLVSSPLDPKRQEDNSFAGNHFFIIEDDPINQDNTDPYGQIPTKDIFDDVPSNEEGDSIHWDLGWKVDKKEDRTKKTNNSQKDTFQNVVFSPFQNEQDSPAEEQAPLFPTEYTWIDSNSEYEDSEDDIIAQADTTTLPITTGQLKTPPKTILINFNNVHITEYIRFVSRLTNRNFVFDEANLDFNVTIISEEPTTLNNVITALIQELRIHGFSLIEEGNNMIIHKNQQVRSISRVNLDGPTGGKPKDTELVTQVFKLNTLAPGRARAIITPLLSSQALIELSEETRHIIITDMINNINQIGILLKGLDAPSSGLVIGQYVVRNAVMDSLIELAGKIMAPIAKDQQLTFVPHPPAQSIFIVSSPFLVEKTISVLQHLDSFEISTRIYDLDDLKFQQITPTPTLPETAPEGAPPPGLPPEGPLVPPPEVPTPEIEEAEPGRWEVSPQGEWIFRPGFPREKEEAPGDRPPAGEWFLDPQGKWYFSPTGVVPDFARRGLAPEKLPGERPDGRWTLDPQGTWIFQLNPGVSIQPKRLKREAQVARELPLGHIERTKFYIHKLQFKKGDDIVDALQRIGNSLQIQGTSNIDLALTIQSTQWLETSNSLVFTGTEASLDKVKELIDQIDAPLRQVFIEMLILETTVDDSLTYGTSWASRSGGGNTSTAQAFLGGASPLAGALEGSGVSDGESMIPDASVLATTIGYNLGIIGQRITHNGTQFASLGALVTALHQRNNVNIVMNPKIITEENNTAEIFVGINTRFQTQAVSNDEGSIITTNYEFRDVGTQLRVTPLIGNNDVVTLEIEQEVSRTGGEGTGGAEGESISDISPGPTTSVNRTTTIVHIPDKHFLIISGMIEDEKIRDRNNLPCLGGVPFIGAAFSSKRNIDVKRNLMIFIRPQIIDTEEQMRKLTRQQQEILKQKQRTKTNWKYEVDEALDFLNIKPTCCDVCD